MDFELAQPQISHDCLQTLCPTGPKKTNNSHGIAFTVLILLFSASVLDLEFGNAPTQSPNYNPLGIANAGQTNILSAEGWTHQRDYTEMCETQRVERFG